MKLKQKQSELLQMKKNQIMLLALSGTLLALALIQGLTVVFLLQYAHNKHEIHFIPPHISKEFSISHTGISESYLRDMTSFLVQLRFNVTPTSAHYQFNTLLGYVDSSLYGVIRAQLVKEVELIQQEHLSSVFYPILIELDCKGLTAKVSGQMKRSVGAELMSEVKETYLIHFAYEQGLLKITRLERVNG
ncbi:type IV conjugative transfer system protein TraE [Legionella longbeachae]|uniref:type IV conjugative transfer system protein TraE n=1 Tax=Legionella longbeachae TaxID=450 RepID=UPI0009B78DE2|nr:type IV conjugative transfer system protein TraE [Legionella longbeachae]VEE02709.1 putative conjugative transfer protein TraE [Legionella oakridgensis]ARB91028.1 type IV conjugative transfer system protein TraE [Legionella longbeachae]ARM32545.1 type IV conjugative transfer system protein TraE [Legionella longbeachae]RZV21181.1 type IV conjugative transfer system protein TraE [Legionella longbeachae]UAK45772.1 type IV conjugative transfer system protein TraE [Legionella longbeachae]